MDDSFEARKLRTLLDAQRTVQTKDGDTYTIEAHDVQLQALKYLGRLKGRFDDKGNVAKHQTLINAIYVIKK